MRCCAKGHKKKVGLLMSKVCIGVPVYNGSPYLRQSLDALLKQSYQDFRVIILDDGSTDDSFSQLQEYATADSRIALYQNQRRTGLIRAWNRVAELAGASGPPEYFAWYSDHDWVDQDWLEALVQSLDSDAEIVLAHSRTVLFNAAGDVQEMRPDGLDTASLPFMEAVRKVTVEAFGAGDAVYGVFRYKWLARIGFLPLEILPDRLLVSESFLHGAVKFVATTTRYRRDFIQENNQAMLQRQMINLFDSESSLPSTPYVSHATYLFRKALRMASTETDGARAEQRILHSLLYMQYIVGKNELMCEDERSRVDLRLRPYADFGFALMERDFSQMKRLATLQKRYAMVKVKYKARLASSESYCRKLEAREKRLWWCIGALLLMLCVVLLVLFV